MRRPNHSASLHPAERPFTRIARRYRLPVHALRVTLATPPPGPSGAAIAILQLNADDPADLDAALASLNIAPVPLRRSALRRLAGIDMGLVARWTPRCAHLMPHGGRSIVSQLLARLAAHGVTPIPPTDLYPEAADLIEACTLDTLARAASPLAIDLLLHQRDLWRINSPAGRGLRGEAPKGEEHPTLSDDNARRLQFLIDPPTVLLLGPPNIGKSTLANALASRTVSIVADTPGTTRDHVGVMLNLAGLVVRWIDAPGINPDTADPIEREAISIALDTAPHADLILLCSDAYSPAPSGGGVASLRATEGARPPSPLTLRLALRADLGLPAAPVDIITSAATNQGLADLALAVREALVPSHLLTTNARWRFHLALPSR
jgi:hypothetical protein